VLFYRITINEKEHEAISFSQALKTAIWTATNIFLCGFEVLESCYSAYMLLLILCRVQIAIPGSNYGSGGPQEALAIILGTK
jgi:hypothetical protein